MCAGTADRHHPLREVPGLQAHPARGLRRLHPESLREEPDEVRRGHRSGARSRRTVARWGSQRNPLSTAQGERAVAALPSQWQTVNGRQPRRHRRQTITPPEALRRVERGASGKGSIGHPVLGVNRKQELPETVPDGRQLRRRVTAAPEGTAASRVPRGTERRSAAADRRGNPATGGSAAGPQWRGPAQSGSGT